MTRNERTSARVAKIAAKVMRMKILDCYTWINLRPEQAVRDIRTLAASCLTQTADKPKRKKPVAS